MTTKSCDPAFGALPVETRPAGKLTNPHEGLLPTLPRQLRGAELDATLAVIRVNALAERWDACHDAIKRLKGEAHAARPSNFRLAERVAFFPSEIGIDLRIANALEAYGLETVEKLLAADYECIARIPNLANGAIDHIKRRLLHVFEPEIGRVTRGPNPRPIDASTAELVLAWPRGRPVRALEG